MTPLKPKQFIQVEITERRASREGLVRIRLLKFPHLELDYPRGDVVEINEAICAKFGREG